MQPPSSAAPLSAASPLTAAIGADLAQRALANIAREYPNHPQLLLDVPEDLRAPRTVHPIFFGAFDWHSAVHNHWLLLRLYSRDVLSGSLRAAIDTALATTLTAENASVEADYLLRRPGFERPYGLAWLALLIAEAQTTRWQPALLPLWNVGRANVVRWLETARYPVRSGTHGQSAFALTLLHDAASRLADGELGRLVRRQALAWFAADAGAALRFEPSGDDFLSPALMEADLLRRVLPTLEFATWLDAFLPELARVASAEWLPCGDVDDETDGKAVHLHGLNLSRAWNLENVAAALPCDDPRRAALAEAGSRHRAAGLRATLATRHYASDHWLPSFAVYLLTGG